MATVLDSFIATVQRQHAEQLFSLQAIPVVGAVVSIAGTAIALAKTIQKVAQALFSVIKNAIAQTTDNERAYREELWQGAQDWGIILANQILNLGTAGLLNNVVVPLSFCRVIGQYHETLQEEANMAYT